MDINATRRQFNHPDNAYDAMSIPSDWSFAPLNFITIEIGDGIHATPNYSQDGEYNFINGNNICDGRIIITEDTKAVESSEFNKYKKNLGTNTVLLSINGTIGNVALYSGEPVVLGKSAAYLNVKNNVNRIYFYYSLQTDLVAQQFEDGITGTTIRNLGLETIRQTQIPIPPTESEQRAIAEALSDVDELVGALDKLIAKKRAIKQGTMQLLLTGKTRLPGFRGEWDSNPLSTLCTIETGRRPKGGVTEEGDIPSLGGENIHNSNGLKLEVIKRVPELFFKSMHSGILKEFDIIINKDGANTGKVAIYTGTGFTHACINEHLFLLRAKEGVDARYFYEALSMDSIRNEINKHIASSAQPGLNRKFYEVIQIRIPELEEQRAIAKVLSDLDAEITALEQRRDKTMQIKQGMMQQLLAGKTRLI
ncbi:hypothetical protein CEE37_05880 [candidate division LCP-89 bacterium B3_LCP]|uniref:Type I restriction modification DNA specificity domain-containing protein n=1 Tax=candidate division LCP-89 bacterium B3_LCP TaxID=2012998 RepID=A0A532V1Y5_UNCL8|nr:MAG: hypothetical protein CEE37_05880 [candidate division LCP-89 bacterium B3_LCP]